MNNPVLENQGRVPPQAVQVEEAILGAMLIESGAADIAIDMLEPFHFYKTANRHIFQTLKELKEAGKSIDLLSLETKLSDKNLLENCGGKHYLSDLTRSTSSGANIEYHSQILIEKWIPRNVILGCNDIIKKAYDGETDPYELIDSLSLFVKNVTDKSFQKIPSSVTQFIKEMLESMVTVYEKKTGIIGVPSYLPIDELTAGFVPGDLIYVAARPSMGKTAYVLTALINNIKAGYKKTIVLFSYEMGKQSLLMRITCMLAEVDLEKARRGKMDESEWGKVFKALEFLGFKGEMDADSKLVVNSTEDSNLYIIDDNDLDVDEVKGICRKIMIEKGNTDEGLGLVITDYLQLMPVRKTRDKNIYNREQEIAYTSRNLKNIAKELNVPVIALSQLSRAVEKRSGDNRPQLSDLRESGSAEQDADVVVFLYRPEYYKIKTTPEGQSTNGLCEVEVAKQRNGPVGMKRHYFEKKYALFSKWDVKEPDAQADVPDDNWSEDIDIDEDTPF